ncbi:MAG: arsenite methyltransferase [Bacteroidetes bacterium]|nr:arsenite methyltransferase [Bacteroidota bacterium]
MKTSDEIKEMVRERYTLIAENEKELNSSCCCGEGSCNSPVQGFTVFSDDYTQLEGYVPEADLGLGCGLPTEFALIKEGDAVVDLGSGAGNDCFVARSIAGESGKVIGIDFTEIMIEKARANAEKLGLKNVQFRFGDIENIPMASGTTDVVISNCVLNLVPDKNKAFSEIYRILKPGGHFSVSDVVLIGELPEKLGEAAAMYAGCIAGALQKADYLKVIKDAGFENVKIQKDKAVNVPDSILLEHISVWELEEFKKSGIGIFSITVYAEKPGQAEGSADCGCSCGCKS